MADAIRSTRKRRSPPGQVAVPEQVQAAVLGVHEVGVDVPLGALVAAVGVVVEVHPPVLGDGRAQHVEHLGAAQAEVDVEHLVGVDAEHGGQLGHAARRARRRRRRRAGRARDAPAVSSATAWSGVSRCGASKTSAKWIHTRSPSCTTSISASGV